MTRFLSLLAAALLLPGLAAAYGGNYGYHCSSAMVKAGKCEKNPGVKVGAVFKGHSSAEQPQVGNNAAPNGPGTGSAGGSAAPMNPAGGAGLPPGAAPPIDPATAAAAASALKDAAPVNGKCPDGSTPVPGLNGTSRCIPGNLTSGGQ